MKTVIWGLSYDVSNHSIAEIMFFLLFFAIILLLIGRFVDVTSCKNNYFILVRSKGYSRVWLRQWLKIEFASFLIIGCMFLLFIMLDKMFSWNIIEPTCTISFFLWFLSVNLIGMIFMLFQTNRYGQTGVFLFIVLVEVFCIYISENVIKVSGILIGNFMMLERSNYCTPEGYPLKVIIIVLGVFITFCGFFGHHIAFRRNG